MQSSYQADKDATSSLGTCTIPLTAAELADLKNVKIVPIIAINACNAGSRYTYIKDIRASVQADYDKYVGGTKVIMADNFEGTTIGTTNQTALNSSFLMGYGIYADRFAANVKTNSNMSVSVVANPTTVGNNSSKVLKVSGTAKDATAWAGFRSLPIPTSVFSSNAEGATIMYDTYRPGANFGNGRVYFHATTNATGSLASGNQNDRSDRYKIMSHMTSAGNKDFTFNSPNGTSANTTMFTMNAADGWQRVAFNLRTAKDGTAIVKMRSCDLSTGIWTDWTKDISFVTPIESLKYLSWAETYNNGITDLYYDNFMVVAGDVSPVAEISGSDANIVMPSDNISVTLNAPVSNAALLDSIKLLDSTGAEVTADITATITDGVTSVTIDPAEDLSAEETYTVDFAGNTTAIGEEIADASFIVYEDWAAPADAPVVTFSNDTKLVDDEVLTVAVEVDGTAVDPAAVAVYADSDAVTITANEEEGVYEITAAKDGAANIYVYPLAYPGAGVSSIAVETVVPENAYTVTYYADDEVVYTEKVAANSIPDGYTIDDESFAGWSTTDGGAVEPFAPVTADMNYYAVLSEVIDIEFVVNNDAYAELIDTVISIPAGATLPNVPDYILADDQVFGLNSWTLNGENYTTSELLNVNIYEPTTITANFAQTKFNFGDEIDLTTITAEEFGYTPFGTDSDFVLTEGTGIELVKSAQTGYSFNFLQEDVAEGTYVIEYDYITNETEDSKFQGFDSGIYGDITSVNKLHGVYLTANETAELMYNTSGAEQVRWNSNQCVEHGVKHTMQYVLDFTTGKALTIIDGEANLVQSADFGYDMAYPEAGSPRVWAPSVKTGGSLLMTRFAYYKLDDANLVKVTVEGDENFDAVGFRNTSGSLNTRPEVYMLEGTKIELGSKITDVEYELDTIVADAGTVELVDDTYVYTAGATDATLSFVSKMAYVTATFDIGEGTLVSGEIEQTLTKGQAPVAPEVEAPAGKVFIGWSPVVAAITTDTIFVANYTDAETVDVTFVAENEDSAKIDMTIKAFKGGNLIALPEYEAINGATFLYWQDEAGNQYTTEELAEVVFDSDATIEGVFKQTSVAGNIYDITKHDFELSDWSHAAADTYTVNEDGSIHIDSTATEDGSFVIAADFPEITSGTWMFEFDLAIEEMGSINGLAGANGSDTQSVYITPNGIYVRDGNGSGGPSVSAATRTLGIDDGEIHNYKLYYDLDNLTFRVVVDNKVCWQASTSLPKASLRSFSYNFMSGMIADLYKIGLVQVDTDDVTVYTASTKDYEYSAAAGSNVYTGPVYAGETLRYVAYDFIGFRFVGWYQDGVEEAISTDLIYDHVVEGDVCIYPKYEMKKVNITYYTADHVTFEGVEGDSWTTADFQRGLKPSAALEVCQPTLVLEDGYVFIGWQDPAKGTVFTGTSYVDTPNDGSVPELVAVVRRAFTGSVNGSIVAGELNRTVEVPVEAETTLAIAKGVIEVRFDDTVLEYVDATVAEAYAGKAVVAQTSTPSLLTITIDSAEEIEIADVIATLNFKVIEDVDNTEITYKIRSVFGVNDEVLEMTSFTTTPSVIVVKALKGDVNLDGKIDVYDAVTVLRSVAGISSLTEDAAEAADVSGNGTVDVSDATLILKYVARLITNF